MIALETVIVLGKILVLPAGASVTYLAYRAYRRTGAVALRSLTLGLAALTTGALLGGGIDRVLGIGTNVGLLLGTACIVAGFTLLVHAAYVRDARVRTIDGELSAPDR